MEKSPKSTFGNCFLGTLFLGVLINKGFLFPKNERGKVRYRGYFLFLGILLAFWENHFKDNASQSLRLGGVCLCERRILKADVKKENC